MITTENGHTRNNINTFEEKGDRFELLQKGDTKCSIFISLFPIFYNKNNPIWKEERKKYIDKRFLLKTTVSDNDFIIRNKAFMKLWYDYKVEDFHSTLSCTSDKIL